ncbi:hypothetical protein CHARACLAT_012008 [Characodon lateralis]|uniref:Uncharacterized protein n=1 Tax=Characodon lateralis TaxID=208331 RepID=A0ABU7F298_9TELE|nr:hypothetical protein [Characodon lateralis]
MLYPLAESSGVPLHSNGDAEMAENGHSESINSLRTETVGLVFVTTRKSTISSPNMVCVSLTLVSSDQTLFFYYFIDFSKYATTNFKWTSTSFSSTALCVASLAVGQLFQLFF